MTKKLPNLVSNSSSAYRTSISSLCLCSAYLLCSFPSILHPYIASSSCLLHLTRYRFLSLIWSWRHRCLFLIGQKPRWNPGETRATIKSLGATFILEIKCSVFVFFLNLKKKTKKLYVNMFKKDTNSIKMLLRAAVCRVFFVAKHSFILWGVGAKRDLRVWPRPCSTQSFWNDLGIFIGKHSGTF